MTLFDDIVGFYCRFLAEILKSNAAIWMSGGQYFIYASFNDSKVGVQVTFIKCSNTKS